MCYDREASERFTMLSHIVAAATHILPPPVETILTSDLTSWPRRCLFSFATVLHPTNMRRWRRHRDGRLTLVQEHLVVPHSQRQLGTLQQLVVNGRYIPYTVFSELTACRLFYD